MPFRKYLLCIYPSRTPRTAILDYPVHLLVVHLSNYVHYAPRSGILPWFCTSLPLTDSPSKLHFTL